MASACPVCTADGVDPVPTFETVDEYYTHMSDVHDYPPPSPPEAQRIQQETAAGAADRGVVQPARKMGKARRASKKK